MIIGKVVCTLGLITLEDKKMQSNNYHFVYVGRLINILVLYLLQYLNWIERYSIVKIGRFFFVEYILNLELENLTKRGDN